MTLQEPASCFRPAAAPHQVWHPQAPVGGSALFWRGKRVFDIGLSLALLPLLLGIGALLLVLNPLANPGPLFFRQVRMGRDCAPFAVLKFRTMSGPPQPTRDPDEGLETTRITRLGRVMRQTRIDEFPQILNVLRGEMSLIGPRPDCFDHAAAFLRRIPDYRARHTVRPGISGLAQVTLGYAEGVEATRAKVAADLLYLRHAGPWLEAWVFWRTLATIAARAGR